MNVLPRPPAEQNPPDGRLPACPPLIKALFAANALMGLFAVAGFFFGSHGGAWDFVRLGEESNLPTWYSSSQLLLIALVLLPLAVRDVGLRSPRTWPLMLIPAFFVLLSIDEGAMVHERIGDWFQASTSVGSGLITGPWMLVYVPIAGTLLLVVLHAGWPYLRGRRGALTLLAAGVFTLGAYAVGYESVANLVMEGSLAQKWLGFAEEIGEMCGATLLLWGALEVVRLEGVALMLSPSWQAERLDGLDSDRSAVSAGGRKMTMIVRRKKAYSAGQSRGSSRSETVSS